MRPVALRHAIAHREERGQILVIVAGGLLAMIAMVGLVIDGGHAWGRQRQTQNGADAIAKAGATQILEWLDGATVTGGDVGCAVENTAGENGVQLELVQYTEWDGSLMGTIPACGNTTPVPAEAQGVRAVAREDFDTFLMQVVGFDQLTARADAIAVVGPITGTSPALPVTFPQTMGMCDDTGNVYTIRDWDEENDESGPAAQPGQWDPYEILPTTATLSSTNLAIIPLCTTAPGSVGWLEFNCGNLAEEVAGPCDFFATIPGWVQTQSGNVNNLEDELAGYHGDQPGIYEPETSTTDTDTDQRTKLPIHATTCESNPGVSDTDGDGDMDLNLCPSGSWSGEGNNLYYGIPFWVGFVLDEAYVGGSDRECQQDFGQPQLVRPSGFVGCLKGWFVKRIGPPDEVSIGDVNPGDPVDLGVTLIN